MHHPGGLCIAFLLLLAHPLLTPSTDTVQETCPPPPVKGVAVW